MKRSLFLFGRKTLFTLMATALLPVVNYTGTGGAVAGAGQAFAQGADGVLIGGCHLGDCHYVEGNYKTVRRFQMLQRLLRDMGVEDQRVRLEWISASEGERVKTVINDMVAQVRALGPLNLPQRRKDWDGEMTLPAEPAGHGPLAEQRAAPEVAHA